MENKKVREFWVNDNAEGDGTFSVSKTPWFGYIHVIEYRALTDAQARIAELEKENKVHSEINRKLANKNADLEQMVSEACAGRDQWRKTHLAYDSLKARADKLKNVLEILNHPAYKHFSDDELAAIARVSDDNSDQRAVVSIIAREALQEYDQAKEGGE